MKRKIARVFLELMRNHITAMAIISVVNMILIISGSKYIIYFSALLPQFLIANGFSMAISSGYSPLETISVVLGGIFVLLLILTVLFSYKHRAWHLVAAGLVLADLSIAFYMLFGEGNMSFLPDAIVNGYVVLVSVGAFFVSGALFPKRRSESADFETDEYEEEAAYDDDLTVGYGDYLLVANTSVKAVKQTEAPVPEPEALPEAVETAEKAELEEKLTAVETEENSELEDGVLLKITFRVPTLKTLKEALGISEKEDEEE